MVEGIMMLLDFIYYWIFLPCATGAFAWAIYEKYLEWRSRNDQV